MSAISTNSSISEMFNKTFDNIAETGKALRDKMAKLDGDNISPEDMLKLQFEMGQYNAMLETLSTVTKSLTDEAKSLGQRSN